MDWFNKVNKTKGIFYNSEQAERQVYCDKKLKELPCKDVVINYLLSSRENVRQQKKELGESSLLDFFNVIDRMNKDNEKFLDKLYETINIKDNLEVCKRLKKNNFY
jgi:hypothetical protein